jgi:hypothetical protein
LTSAPPLTVAVLKCFMLVIHSFEQRTTDGLAIARQRRVGRGAAEFGQHELREDFWVLEFGYI